MSNSAAQKIDTVIPLGQRISEIMQEKGDAFSIRAFAARIGMSKDMLSRCINGDRYLKPSELEKIAKGLNISIRRLKQEDYMQEQNELHKLLKSVVNPKRALELATQLSNVAVGITERSHSLNNLGKALFNLQKYESAHKVWLEAYELVQQMAEDYGESETLYNVLRNLMVSFSMRKEFSRMEEIVEQVEPYFQDDPERLGVICYSVAMAAYDRNQLENARVKLYESLEHFTKTEDQKAIGVAQSNVAYIEYKLRNYHKARELYELAIQQLEHHDYWCLVAVKDYVKTLIKLKDHVAAENHIEFGIRWVEKLEYPELRGKFYLLRSIVRNDLELADQLLTQNEVGKSVHQLSCKFLMNHFSKVGNGDFLLKYYRIAEGLMITHGDILEEDSL